MSTNTLLIFLFLCFLLNFNVFAVSTTAVKCEDTQCDNGICVNGTCICAEGWTGSRCQFCDGRFRLTDSEGTLHDGSGDYPTNTKCTWLIDTNSTKPIKLTFNQFSTECGWDHLHVFDGLSVYSPLVGSFSGISHSVQHVVLHSGKGFLYFFSDVAYSMGGFNITYRSVSCPSDCSGHGQCQSDTELCDCHDSWSGVACDVRINCISNCSDNGICVNGTCLCSSQWVGDDCSIAATDLAWLPVHTNSPPLGRASAGADVLDNYLYVYGGETLLNRFRIHNNDSIVFYRYNILKQSWSSLNSFSAPIDNIFGHTLTSNLDELKLYLYGGYEDAGDRLSRSELASYDTLSSNWTTLPSGPIAVTGHTAHVIHNKLYIFFGQSALYSFVHLIQIYDINATSWSIAKTSGVLVRGRFGHSSVYDSKSDSVFVCGGYRSNYKPGSYKLSPSLYKYMVNTSVWVGLTPAHRPSFLHSAVLSEGFMLISGGNSHNDTVSSSGSQCYSGNLLIYDLCCDKWTEVEADELGDKNLDRFGHFMYTHNESIFVYGGFNGVMLSDMVKLHTPDCTLFKSQTDCELGEGFQSNRSKKSGLCVWDQQRGCVKASRDSTCDLMSCNKTESDKKSKCTQFSSDCYSCTITDDCYYRSSFSPDICSIVPPASTVNPALQHPSNCPNNSCTVFRDCEFCDSQDGCIWSNSNDRCYIKADFFQAISLEDQKCASPCHTRHSCSDCASSSCLWCESQSQCIDSNSYLTNYIYGQCLEWTTSASQCASVGCSELNNCADCQRNAMCGWCNDPSNTGVGVCMRGGLTQDLNSTCQTNGSWYFTTCPECQCNGHSTCDSENNCVECTDNTTGANCETCAPGYFGVSSNGGHCQRCQCDQIADACDDKTGACKCRVQGATGDACLECDKARQYYKDTISNKDCYYRLGVDYKYIFNFSKPEDKHVTIINLQTMPRYDNRDIEFTLSCGQTAYVNLTMYSVSSSGEALFDSLIEETRCAGDERTLKILHKNYNFDKSDNATILLTLYDFKTPFTFQISFTQYSGLDLLRFFLIFFGCFLALLVLAGIVWKLRARYTLMERRHQERQERRAMASRPFSSILLIADDLKSVSCIERSSMQLSNGTGESLSTFQRTFSRRSKNKPNSAGRSMATPVGLEPLEALRSSAVSSVIFKLPTGEAETPGYGCSGLAIGSALVSIPTNNTSNYALTKVSYKHGKVTFKYP